MQTLLGGLFNCRLDLTEGFDEFMLHSWIGPRRSWPNTQTHTHAHAHTRIRCIGRSGRQLFIRSCVERRD